MAKQISLTVRVPETLNRLIQRKAVRDGTSKSEVIRIALIRALDENLGGAAPEKSGDLQGVRRSK